MRLKLKKVFITSVVSTFFVATAQGQITQPVPECATVNADGSVTIEWQNSQNASPGGNNQVYRDDGGGFVFVDNVPYPLETYTDIGVDASLQAVSYYLIYDTSPAEEPVDTITTIFLELLPSGSSSVASLDWNFPFQPMPAEGEFVVEKREDPGVFEELAVLTPQQNAYLDTLFGFCDSTAFSYRVSFRTDDCFMFSQILTQEFIDIDGPPIPEVETISVDPETGNVELYWDAVVAPDLAAYVIQKIDGGTFVTVGNEDADQTSFILDDGSGGVGQVTLAVRSEDVCGNENSFENTYTTMFTQATFTDCELNAFINWTSYDGWPEGVAQYEVRALVNGTDDVLIETVAPGVFEYEAEVEANTEYLFYVRALSNGDQRPSDSNGALIVTDYPELIDYQYVSSVSVNEQNELVVQLLQDPEGVGITYELYRAEGNGIFQLLGEFIATEEDTMTYIDSDVRPWEVIYTYFWRAFDGCGELIGDSNSGRNMVVSGRTLENEIVNRLNWNTYEEWENGVEEYRVFRSLGDPEDFQLLTTLSPGFTEFEDDVEEFKEVEGRFCYRIEAVESPNQFGSGAVALSNTICVVQPPIAWIPNAIVLGGFNDEFRPVLGFIDFETYAMEIYNKWGELLFETRDYAEAWDGTYRGNAVPEDYYRYIISFRDGQGKPVIEEGVLYVLRGAE